MEATTRAGSRIFLVVLLATWAAAATGCLLEADAPAASAWTDTARAGAESAPVRDHEAGLRRLAATRQLLAASFRAAKGDGRAAVRRQAARVLEEALVDDVLPRWDGTPWAFSGTSTTPGSGSIACGYFVSTTLLESGLHVERARLAQQAAEDIIKTLAPASAIARFSDVPIDDFVAEVARRGDGLYVVGLDNHVGYLVVRAGQVLFHHSSYVGEGRVVREPAISAGPLVSSRYRVIGKLFTDTSLVEAWLEERPIPTKSRRT